MKRMSDEEMMDALAGVLASHPSWAQPRRFNVFAFSVEDAAEALRAAYGEQTGLLTALFRTDVLGALQAAGGREGFWVSDAAGTEMFFEAADESSALRMFEAQFGAAPVSCASSALVREELARMEASLGEGEPPLMSSAFAQAAAVGA